MIAWLSARRGLLCLERIYIPITSSQMSPVLQVLDESNEEQKKEKSAKEGEGKLEKTDTLSSLPSLTGPLALPGPPPLPVSNLKRFSSEDPPPPPSELPPEVCSPGGLCSIALNCCHAPLLLISLVHQII